MNYKFKGNLGNEEGEYDKNYNSERNYMYNEKYYNIQNDIMMKMPPKNIIQKNKICSNDDNQDINSEMKNFEIRENVFTKKCGQVNSNQNNYEEIQSENFEVSETHSPKNLNNSIEQKKFIKLKDEFTNKFTKQKESQSEKLIYHPTTYKPALQLPTGNLQNFIKTESKPKQADNKMYFSTKKNYESSSIQMSPLLKSVTGVALKKNNLPINSNMLNSYSRSNMNSQKFSNPYINNKIESNNPKEFNAGFHKEDPNTLRQIRNNRKKFYTHSFDISTNPNFRNESVDGSVDKNNFIQTQSTRWVKPKTPPKSFNRSMSNYNGRDNSNPNNPNKNFKRSISNINPNGNNQNKKGSFISQSNNILSFGNEHSDENVKGFNSHINNSLPLKPLRTVHSNLSQVMRNQHLYNNNNNGNLPSGHKFNKNMIDFQDVTHQFNGKHPRSVHNFNPTTSNKNFHNSGMNHETMSQNIAPSVFNNPEIHSISPEDMENRLVLLFRKSIVFTSKIESLKKKILKTNPEFSSLQLFKQFCNPESNLMSHDGLYNMFQSFNFAFGTDYVDKVMIYLSKFRIGERSGDAEQMGYDSKMSNNYSQTKRRDQFGNPIYENNESK